MGRKAAVSVVPAKVLKELGRRYVEQPGLTIEDHLWWLAERGYEITRAPLHRYLKANREKFIQEQSEADEADTEAWSLRLGCLMVAASYALPGDKVDLINTATELEGWVKSTKPG